MRDLYSWVHSNFKYLNNYDFQTQNYGIRNTPQNGKSRIDTKRISNFGGVDKILKVCAHAQKVSHLNWAVDGSVLMGNPPNKVKGSDFAWLC